MAALQSEIAHNLTVQQNKVELNKIVFALSTDETT
jgi:hypothetical protein